MRRTAVINQIRGLLLERGIINNAPWRRTWINRREYVHPYEVRRYGWEERFPSGTCCTSALERERTAAREGRHSVEEHRDHRSR